MVGRSACVLLCRLLSIIFIFQFSADSSKAPSIESRSFWIQVRDGASNKQIAGTTISIVNSNWKLRSDNNTVDQQKVLTTVASDKFDDSRFDIEKFSNDAIVSLQITSHDFGLRRVSIERGIFMRGAPRIINLWRPSKLSIMIIDQRGMLKGGESIELFNDSYEFTGVLDKNLSYTFSSVPSNATLYLKLKYLDHSTFLFPWRSVLLPNENRSVGITLPQGTTVRGRLMLDGLTPVADAEIWMAPFGRGHEPGSRPVHFGDADFCITGKALTGKDGEFRFDNIAPSRYWVGASPMSTKTLTRNSPILVSHAMPLEVGTSEQVIQLSASEGRTIQVLIDNNNYKDSRWFVTSRCMTAEPWCTCFSTSISPRELRSISSACIEDTEVAAVAVIPDSILGLECNQRLPSGSELQVVKFNPVAGGKLIGRSEVADGTLLQGWALMSSTDSLHQFRQVRVLDGKFEFAGLHAGMYSLALKSDGDYISIFDGIRITSEETVSLTSRGLIVRRGGQVFIQSVDNSNTTIMVYSGSTVLYNGEVGEFCSVQFPAPPGPIQIKKIKDGVVQCVLNASVVVDQTIVLSL